MKKFLSLLLALLLTLSLCACQTPEATTPGLPDNGGENQEPSDNNGNGQNNAPQPQPEPTLEEKKQAIKEKLIATYYGNESAKLKSPMELLSALEKDFSITKISSLTDQPGAPVSIYKKGDTILKNYEYYQIHSVVKDGQIFFISHVNGSEPLEETIFDTDSVSLLTAMGMGEESPWLNIPLTPDSDEDSLEVPDLTVDHITVSDDLTTCTVSEEYIKEVLKIAFEEIGEFSPEELDEVLEAVQGSLVYTVAENKFVGSFTVTPPDLEMELQLDIVAIYDPQNGITIELKVTGDANVDDLPINIDLIYAVRNVKYINDAPVSGEIEIKLLGGAEQMIQGINAKMEMEKSIFLSIDRTNEQAPKIEAVIKDTVDAFINGVINEEAGYSLIDTLTCNLNDDGSRNFTYTEEVDGEALYSVNGKITFATPTVDMTVPDSVKQYVEEIYDASYFG